MIIKVFYYQTLLSLKYLYYHKYGYKNFVSVFLFSIFPKKNFKVLGSNRIKNLSKNLHLEFNYYFLKIILKIKGITFHSRSHFKRQIILLPSRYALPSRYLVVKYRLQNRFTLYIQKC